MDVIKHYYFSLNIAKDLGVEEAIMLHNIYFWVKLNRDQNINFHNERYWTYNSAREFSELFPFWSEGQIRRILKNLKSKDYIDVDCFNRAGYDKTRWYTVTRKTLETHAPLTAYRDNTVTDL